MWVGGHDKGWVGDPVKCGLEVVLEGVGGRARGRFAQC